MIHHFSDAVYPSSSSLYHHYNHELGSDFHNPALCNGSSRSLEARREGRVTDLLPDFQFSFIELCSMEILMHFPLERPFLRCTYIFIEIQFGIYSKTRYDGRKYTLIDAITIHPIFPVKCNSELRVANNNDVVD